MTIDSLHVVQQFKEEHVHEQQQQEKRTARKPLRHTLSTVVQSTGTGFIYGTLFGTVIHVFNGIRAAPKHQRLKGAFHHAKAQVPETAGRIAMVACLFRFTSLGLERVRDKNDMWNVLLAAPIAGAFIKIRHGPRAALHSAFAFGSFAAVVIACSKVEAKMVHEDIPPGELLEEIAFAEEIDE